MPSSFPVVSFEVLRKALSAHEIVRASALARLADMQQGLTEKEARELSNYRERVRAAQKVLEGRPVPICQVPKPIAKEVDIDILQKVVDSASFDVEVRQAVRAVLEELFELRAHVRRGA